MQIILVPALALTVATLILCATARLVMFLMHRSPRRFWIRTLTIHLVLLFVHTLITVPIGLAWFVTHFVRTRGDEAAYRGPRIAPDGAWKLQSRDTLKQEEKLRASGETSGDLALDAGAERFAVHFASEDGVPLRAFVVPPLRTTPRFVALLVHGLYRGALELETVGSMLRDAGGEVMLLELRNHGDSGRARPTFGKDESRDVRAAIRQLRDRPEARGRPLVLFAVSLGTAAVALALPDVEGVSALILDAPIDDLRATADRMLGGVATRRQLGPDIPAPFRRLLLGFAEHLFGLDFGGVSPEAALMRLPAQLPVLLIGAGEDDRVPPDSVRRLFERLPTDPARKQLWIVDEARHGKVWEAAPAEYRTHLRSFLDFALGPDL